MFSFEKYCDFYLMFLLNLKYDRSRHASLKALTRPFSGVVLTPEYERVKALSEACLDRSYLGFITNPKNGEVKALSVRVP